MKSTVIDGILELSVIVAVSVYDTKPVHFLLMCCNAIKWVQKIWQVYKPKTEMVRDAHFLRLNVNDSYNHTTDLVDLSDKIQNVHRVDHWMHNYKWWLSLFILG